MTTPAFAQELGDRLPSAGERAAANQLRKILAAQAVGEDETRLRLLQEDDKSTSEVVLTSGLSRLLMEVLRHVGRGDAVTLVPVSQMLTTQQAADILNVSRPYFIGLLDKDEIPHTLVGRHRRIKAEHLFAYKRERDAKRASALSELAALDGEHL
ncbi:excisionase [Caulobacter vibrioides]|nr:excisionase [Caulobacter vibrioides]